MRLRLMPEAVRAVIRFGFVHEPFTPVLAREDVAQLGVGVLGCVVHVHTAGADERATVLEDDAPAAQVSPLVALHREAQERL